MASQSRNYELNERIDDSELLLRRAFRNKPAYISKTGTISSRAFELREKDNGLLSLNIKRLTAFELFVHDADKFALCQILTKVFHDNGARCLYAPESDNPAHVLVHDGSNDDVYLRTLAESAQLIDYPRGSYPTAIVTE